METLFVGSNIIFLPQVDSTNSYAINLLKNVNLPEGTVVHTANQTAGRGQRGNSWLSDTASNLTASFVFKPSFLDIKNQFFLYQVTALACYDVLAELLAESQIDIKIKWPNDILVQGKKTAGILIENTLSHNKIDVAIVGVGLNVNQVVFGDNVKASSLKAITGKDYIVTDVINLLSKHLEKWYMLLKKGKTNEIKAVYLERLMGLGEILNFEVENRIKKFSVKGVSERGLLLLGSEDGTNSEFDVKEIKWVI